MNLIDMYKEYYKSNALFFKIKKSLEIAVAPYVGQPNNREIQSRMVSMLQESLERFAKEKAITSYNIKSHAVTGETYVNYGLPGFDAKQSTESIRIEIK